MNQFAHNVLHCALIIAVYHLKVPGQSYTLD